MKSSVVNISPQEFVQLANPPLLIDVSSQLEYAMFHAPDAINLSLPRILLGGNSWLHRWVLPQWFQKLSSEDAIALDRFWFGERGGNRLNYCHGLSHPSPIRRLVR